jgi:sodium/hydrogen antiporter
MVVPDAFTLGCIIVGTLLIAKTLGGSFIARLPLSAAMLYLGVGIAVGSWGWGLLKLDAFKNTVLLERLTEVALLISLFTAGMRSWSYRSRTGAGAFQCNWPRCPWP